MKSVLSVTVICLTVIATSRAQGSSFPPSSKWSVNVPQAQARVDGFAVDVNGNLLVGSASTATMAFSNVKGYLTKYDALGSQLWQEELPERVIRGLITDEAGNSIVTGIHRPAPYATHSTWFRMYGPDGATLSTVSIPHQFGDNTYVAGLVRDSAGNLYTTGSRSETIPEGERTDQQMILQKWSPSGQQIWTKEFGTETGDTGTHIATDASGNVYVLGYSDGIDRTGESASYGSMLFYKFDSAGNELWQREIMGPEFISPLGFAADASGNLFIGGGAGFQIGQEAFGEQDAFVSRWDSDGNEVWTKQFGTSGHDVVNAIAIGAAGEILIAGGLRSNAYTVLRQLDYDGNIEWNSQVYHSPFEDRRPIRNIAENVNGDLYVAGTTGSIEPDGFIELLTFATADFNNDGDVDGRDFLAWQRGESPRPLSVEDLALWHEQYGNASAVSALNNTSAVPEPNSLALVLCSLLLAARARVR